MEISKGTNTNMLIICSLVLILFSILVYEPAETKQESIINMTMKDALDAVYLCSDNNTLEPLVNEYNSLDSMKNLEIQLSFDKDYIYIKHKDTILSKERNQ